jgi:hypothetical protein
MLASVNERSGLVVSMKAQAAIGSVNQTVK